MHIKELLAALDDPSVQEKIKLIVNNEVHLQQEHSDLEVGHGSRDLDDLIAENARLLEQLEHLDKEYLALTSSNEALADLNRKQQIELDETRLELSSKIEDLTHVSNKMLALESVHASCTSELQVLEYYRNEFGDDMRIYETYCALSEQTRESLSGIFKSTSVKGLISCGVQEKNVLNLWEYIKNEVVNGNNVDLINLSKLFDMLFERFQLAYPMFERQQSDVGDEFDTQTHIKHNSSVSMSGCIKQILLAGYTNSKNGNVIKPSVVVL